MILPRDDVLELGTYIGRTRDQDGNPDGHRSANLLLTTKPYKVEF